MTSILGAVFSGSDVLIEVVLKGNADQRCDGIAELFRQILCVIGASGGMSQSDQNCAQ